MIKEEQFLNFNKLKIYQDDTCFKYNLDSILLADFVLNHYKKGKIIDLATGTIPIPLFLAYHLKKEITAVELQKNIYEIGCKTIKENHLEDFIHLIHEDINHLKQIYTLNSFDVVICNPPYFPLEEKRKISNEISKSVARHEVTLKLEDVIDISKYLLKNKGSLFLIYRTERITELLNLLRRNNLEPKIIRNIYSNVHSNSKLFLIEARLNGGKGCIIEKPLIIYSDSNKYSLEILKMFGDDSNDTKKL